ncbi:hypothetical protein C1646_776856, partial [Rhizophagus diaphanus]
MLTDALKNERNAHKEYWEIVKNRKEQIGELLCEKFAFRLLIQHKEMQIGEHRRNAYRLTNNAPVNQQIRMVLGFGLPVFKDYPGEDPEDFMRSTEICIIGNVNKCGTWCWSSWRKSRDNLGVANLTAARLIAVGNNNNQIEGMDAEFQGKATNEIARIGNGVAAGTDLIPVAEGFPVITIVQDIRIGQKLYILRYFYTTVEYEKQLVYFGQLTQGDKMEERVSARQKKPVTEDDINRIVEERISARQKKPVTDSRDAFSALEIIAKRLGYPESSPRNIDSINRFIEQEIGKLGHETFYTRVLRKKPRRRTYVSKKSTKKTGKSKRHCSNCGRTGHTKTNCSSKKRSRKVNYVQTNDLEENTSEGSETEESNSDSDSGAHCYMNSRDGVSETETESETELSSDKAEQCPRRKEVTKKNSKKKTKSKDNGVKNEYITAKDLLLSQYIPNCSSEEKEEIWKQVTEVYNDILLPLIEAIYQLQVNYYITFKNMYTVILPVFGKEPRYTTIQQPTGLEQNVLALNQAIKTYQKAQMTNTDSHQIQLCKSSIICYPKPFEINFIHLNAPNDVATICCKIYSEIMPYAIIDTGLDSSIISENIAENLGIEIDKNSSHEIISIASLAKTRGMIHDLPITIGHGGSKITIRDGFLVVETEKDKNGKDKSLLILGVVTPNHVW